MRTMATNRKVMNQFGEMVKAKVVLPKSSGIFHETVDGKWVKKVIAVREGLTLTGKRRRMTTKGIWSLWVA